jgi:hypothetical protein
MCAEEAAFDPGLGIEVTARGLGQARGMDQREVARVVEIRQRGGSVVEAEVDIGDVLPDRAALRIALTQDTKRFGPGGDEVGVAGRRDKRQTIRAAAQEDHHQDRVSGHGTSNGTGNPGSAPRRRPQPRQGSGGRPPRCRGRASRHRSRRSPEISGNASPLPRRQHLGVAGREGMGGFSAAFQCAESGPGAVEPVVQTEKRQIDVAVQRAGPGPCIGIRSGWPVGGPYSCWRQPDRASCQ